MTTDRPATPNTPNATAMVDPEPGAPLFSIIGFIAVLVATLAVFNAVGRTAGLVLAVIALLLAGVALIEVIVPRRRGGRVTVATIVTAGLAILLAGARLGGYSILGDKLPADDPRSTSTTMPQ